MAHTPHEVFRGDGAPIGPTAGGTRTKPINQLNNICKIILQYKANKLLITQHTLDLDVMR